MVIHWFTQALLFGHNDLQNLTVTSALMSASKSFIKYIPKENARGSLWLKEITIPNTKDCGTNTFRYKGVRLWNSYYQQKLGFFHLLTHLKLLYKNIFLHLIPSNSVYIRMSCHFVLQDKYLLFHLILKYFTYFYN